MTPSDDARLKARADLLERARRVREMLEEARHMPLSETEPLDPAVAEEMIEEIRRGRDTRP